jgi:hypothetical protein
MSAIQFTNEYVAELVSNLTAVATTIPLKSGHGANFPVVAVGEEKHFFVTVVDKNGNREIVKIIKRASGSDTLTVGSSVSDQSSGNVSGRAQEGTTALAITSTDDHAVVLRLTAGIMEWIANAIPAGEIILFEKDTAALGYTLKTDVDDGLVYVTRGSGASGETGGTAKSGGTWTQPGHTHTGPSHAHSGPSHTHNMASHTHLVSGQTQGPGRPYAGAAIDHAAPYYNDHAHNLSITSQGPSTNTTSAAGTGDTGLSGTGNTGSGATANTWRPTGRNFTRQQRN